MDRDSMAWYVCGPMTGIPRFNYPLFDIVTAHLRLEVESEVISPTELDSKRMQKVARESFDGSPTDMVNETGESWGDVLARDVRIIEKKVGNFALLPGWRESRGARLEVFVALLVGVKSFHEVSFTPTGKMVFSVLTDKEIRTAIRENMP